MYERMEYGLKQYPGFLPFILWGSCRRIKQMENAGCSKLGSIFLEGLCFVLKSDAKVRLDAFTDSFTAEKFSDVLFSLMLSALLRQDLRSGRCAGDHPQNALLKFPAAPRILSLKTGTMFKKRRRTMKVKRNTLLLLACLVWSAAGIQYTPHRIDRISAVSVCAEFFIVYLSLRSVSEIYFWEIGKKHTARINAYLEERHFFFKFLIKSFCHYGCDDDRRYWAACKWDSAGEVYRSVLYWPGRFASGRGIVGRNFCRAVFNVAAMQNKNVYKGRIKVCRQL